MAPLSSYIPPYMRDSNYRTLAHKLSNAFKIPEALVSYVLLEKLYAEKPVECKRHLPQSALHHSLMKVKGSYEIVTLYDRLFVRFADGTTISSSHADMTWCEFFREMCVGRPQQLFTNVLGVIRKSGI